MTRDPAIPVISVGICRQKELRFSLSGAYRFSDSALADGEYRARAADGRIIVEQHGTRVGAETAITLVPGAADATIVLYGVTIGVQFHWQRQEDQRFVGSLKLLADGDAVVAVNVLSVEDYLTSVISSEMSKDSSLSLLEAHAITSRSWLIAQLEKSRALKAEGRTYTTVRETDAERIRWYDREEHALFDVCADDHCQRYQGITKAHSAAVSQAINGTRGQVLMFDGKVCDARFSKSCGGVTEAFEAVWEPVHHPYLLPVADSPGASPVVPDLLSERNAAAWIRGNPESFCNTSDAKILSQVLLKYDQETSDFFRWKVEYTQEELASIIRKRSGIDFGLILDLIPVERSASSRLTRLRIVGSKRTMVIGKELEIRRTLSNSHLYSSAMVFEKADSVAGIPTRFMLYGAGWGHGVGLCQIGAAVMGEKGYTPRQILAHYFPHAMIGHLY